MSGLYTMIMGRNPAGPALLDCVGLRQEYLGRYRDAYTNDDGNRVFVLTRNYGAEYAELDQVLAAHPFYVDKKLCSDETYTVYEFMVPPSRLSIVKEIAEASDNTPLFQQYEKAVKDFADGKENAMTQRMKEVGKQLIAPMLQAMDGAPDGEQTVRFGDGEMNVIHFGGKNESQGTAESGPVASPEDE